MWNRLTPDQPTGLKQPLVLSVKLLERVIRQHNRASLISYPEHKRVSASNRTRRRSYQLVIGYSLVKFGGLRFMDSMAKGGIHHNGHGDTWVFTHKRQNGVVKLRKTGR
jgi:hypothetical protein